MWGMLAENQLQKDVVVFAKKIPAAITEEANPEFSSHFLFTTNLLETQKYVRFSPQSLASVRLDRYRFTPR